MSILSFSSHIQRLRGALRDFRSSRSGNIALAFALAIIPIIGAIGSALDYSNALKIRTQLQAASDSGVLAVVSAVSATSTPLTDDQVSTSVKNFIAASLSNGQGGNSPTVTVSRSSAGVVTANASVAVPTRYMKVFGLTSMTIHAASAATVAGSAPVTVEVALVLDTTLSMNDNGKIAALQTAAKTLVQTIMTSANTSAGKVKVSVVPYAQYVNVGTVYKGAWWLGPTVDRINYYAASCYDNYPYINYGTAVLVTYACLNDGVPATCSYYNYPNVVYGPNVPICYPAGSWTSYWYGCVGSRDYPLDLTDTITSTAVVPAFYDFSGCPTPLTRLTTNQGTVISAINALTPSGETYIAPGLLWGWRTLSPNAPFGDGKPYSTSALKYIVLMTDGFNTHSVAANGYGGTHDWTDIAGADARTLETCAAIKASGVKIFTVSFQVVNNTAAPMLKSCATDTSSYYDAISNAALQTAFGNIATNINNGLGKAHLTK